MTTATYKDDFNNEYFSNNASHTPTPNLTSIFLPFDIPLVMYFHAMFLPILQNPPLGGLFQNCTLKKATKLDKTSSLPYSAHLV
ncbi:hypothetical protein HOLleu_36696 [Holothuria leucospilota]|uniref:Uncharacterized protein n=1 Tax=Holothuria leucospilota TaxID=206669 RepID=A0A9Q0YK74_HOLLE|nr:hypothetical protein HOLleu_36696 [Holothuria leucospilota]